MTKRVYTEEQVLVHDGNKYKYMEQRMSHEHMLGNLVPHQPAFEVYAAMNTLCRHPAEADHLLKKLNMELRLK